MPALRNFRITPFGLANALESGVNPVDTEMDYDVGGDLKYGITPKSIPNIEPLQLLLLEAVNQALGDAGYLDRLV